MSLFRAEDCTCPGGLQTAEITGHLRSDCPHFGEGEAPMTHPDRDKLVEELESALCAPTWALALFHVHQAMSALRAPQAGDGGACQHDWVNSACDGETYDCRHCGAPMPKAESVGERAREAARQWRGQTYYALKPLGDAAIRALQNSVEDTVYRALSQGRDAGIEEGWRDIASAPRDGTPLLLRARCKGFEAECTVIGWWLPEQEWIELAFAPNNPVGIVPSAWCALRNHILGGGE